jgi:hypothetical protein
VLHYFLHSILPAAGSPKAQEEEEEVSQAVADLRKPKIKIRKLVDLQET